MPLTIKPEEVLLPEQFLDAAQKHLDNLSNYQMDKLVLLEDNVIPSVVMMRYDRLAKMLKPDLEEELANAVVDKSDLSKAESMLLTIRDRIHFFNDMAEEEILDVIEKIDFLRLKENETIFEQFSTGKEIYYIIKGDVAISGYMEKSQETDPYTNLTILEAGQVFGELGPILGEGRTARASVASKEAFILVMELKEDEGTSTVKVYKNLMRSLARKLIRTNNQLYPFICD